MAEPFQGLINNLWDLGFPTFLIFIFFLAVVYGLLRRGEFFEDDTVDATVAVVVAFLVTGGSIQFLGGVESFVWFFSMMAAAVVILLGFVLILGMMGVDITEVMNENEARRRNVAILAGFVLVGVLLYMLSFFMDIERYLTSDLVAGVLMVVAMFGFVYLVAKSGD